MVADANDSKPALPVLAGGGIQFLTIEQMVRPALCLLAGQISEEELRRRMGPSAAPCIALAGEMRAAKCLVLCPDSPDAGQVVDAAAERIHELRNRLRTLRWRLVRGLLGWVAVAAFCIALAVLIVAALTVGVPTR